MKKAIIFLILFLLLISGVYLYQKNNLGEKIIIPPLNPNQTNLTSTKEIGDQMETTVKEPVTEEEINQGLVLEVYEPKEGAIVNSSKITVRGKTSSQAEVFVNEKELKADKEGNFSTTIDLDEGENVITLVASDEQGNYAERELTVILETVE